MIKIKNMEELVGKGATKFDRKARELALKSLETALNAADPKQIIESKVFLKNAALHVDKYSFNLKDFRNIYVIGGGKASGSMVEALEKILGTYIKDGVVNVPYDDKSEQKSLKFTVLVTQSQMRRALKELDVYSKSQKKPMKKI